MLQTPAPRPAGAIASVEAIVVDLPFRRLQRFARLEARAQTTVIVRLRDGMGAEGIGECCVPCGPWWSGDCVESIAALIDHHLAPALVGADAARPSEAMARLDRVARGAPFAKAGLEMALLDLLGRRLDAPISTLLGGALRDAVPVAWPVASGNEEDDRREIEQKLQDGEASGFKIKLGTDRLEADIARATRIAAAIDGRGYLIVDPNEGWTEAQAIAALPRLEGIGIDLIEQPLRRDLATGMARLAARTAIPLMADEGVQTEAEALQLACSGGAQVLSIKIMKAGGLMASRRMADIAWAGGVTPYLGTFLESSIGTAAGLQLGAALPDLFFGGEVIGPMLLSEDIVQRPVRYAGGAAQVPPGPGLGMTLDEDRLREFRRA